MLKKNIIILMIFFFSLNFISSYNFEDGASTVNVYQGNVTNLTQMQDVNAPTPNNDDSLTWDDATKMWVAQAITGGSGGDGNASSICSNDEVLLGNGTCQTSNDFFDGTGLNYTEKTVNAYNESWSFDSNWSLTVLLNWLNFTYPNWTTAQLNTFNFSTLTYCVGEQFLMGNGSCSNSTEYIDAGSSGGNTTQEIRDAVNSSIDYSFNSNRSNYWQNVSGWNSTKMRESNGILDIIIDAGTWLYDYFYSKAIIDEMNTTKNVQILLNDTGIYETYNATYEANLDTNWTTAQLLLWFNYTYPNWTTSDLNSLFNESRYWNKTYADTLYSGATNYTEKTVLAYNETWMDDTNWTTTQLIAWFNFTYPNWTTAQLNTFNNSINYTADCFSSYNTTWDNKALIDDNTDRITANNNTKTAQVLLNGTTMDFTMVCLDSSCNAYINDTCRVFKNGAMMCGV